MVRERSIDLALDLGGGRERLALVGQSETEECPLGDVGRGGEFFDSDISGAKRFFQLLADRLGLLRLVELHRHRHTAGEVDVVVAGPPGEERDQADPNQQGRGGDRQVLLRHEVDLGEPDGVHEVDPLHQARPLTDVEDHPADVDGGVEVHDQPDEQGDGEPLDLLGPDQEQDQGGDQRGDVRVKNGDERLVEPVVNRHPQAGAALQLFPHAFVDQHVGVDRHTGTEHQPGQAGQRERRLQVDHRAHNEQQVQQQRDVGDQAGRAVVNPHEGDDRQRRDNQRQPALRLHIGPQGGADGELADRGLLERHGEGAGVQHVDVLLHFRQGEAVTFDDPLRFDGRIDVRGGLDFSVEQYRQVPLRPILPGGVAGRQVEEPSAPFRLELEADRGTSLLAPRDVRATQVLPGHPLFRGFVHNQDFLEPRRATGDLPDRNVAHPVKLRVGNGTPGCVTSGGDRHPLGLSFTNLDLLGRVPLGLIDQRGVIAAIGQDRKLEAAQLGDLLLDLLDRPLVGTGQDDFNPLFTHAPDHNFLGAIGVHPLLNSPHHAVHQVTLQLEGLARGVGVVDLVNQVCSTCQVDTEVEGLLRPPWLEREAIDRLDQFGLFVLVGLAGSLLGGRRGDDILPGPLAVLQVVERDGDLRQGLTGRFFGPGGLTGRRVARFGHLVRRHPLQVGRVLVDVAIAVEHPRQEWQQGRHDEKQHPPQAKCVLPHPQRLANQPRRHERKDRHQQKLQQRLEVLGQIRHGTPVLSVLLFLWWPPGLGGAPLLRSATAAAIRQGQPWLVPLRTASAAHESTPLAPAHGCCPQS